MVRVACRRAGGMRVLRGLGMAAVVLAVFAPATVGCAEPGAAAANRDLPGARLLGRVDWSDEAGPRFQWSGSAMLARFAGTALRVRLAGAPNQFTVLIDGRLEPVLETEHGTRDYELASGLAQGTHQVEIYRRSEAASGPTQFLGFDPGAHGRMLEPPAASDRRIEVIGDSISCGYGDEGRDSACSFSQDTENHYLTYGAVAARELHADLVTICWTGKGVVQNYGGSRVDTMPVLYGRTLPESDRSRWDFSWQPHAVVINLGTNDMARDEVAPDEFVAGYTRFLEQVRADNPSAFILCTIGPMLRPEELARARRCIAAAVQARKAAGDDKVKAWELTTPNRNPGCNHHPSVATHAAMAAALVAELRADLGW